MKMIDEIHFGRTATKGRHPRWRPTNHVIACEVIMVPSPPSSLDDLKQLTDTKNRLFRESVMETVH